MDADLDANALRRRLGACLQNAELATTEVALNGYPKGADDASSDGARRAELKFVNETALLLAVSCRAIGPADDELRAVHGAICERLSALGRSPETAAAICREPHLAIELGVAHLVLTDIGLPDEEFHRLLVEAMDWSLGPRAERPAHGLLESEWIRRRYLNPERSRSLVRTLVRRSILSARLDLLTISRDDLYAFTHALFYATDFGAHPALSQQQSRAVADYADGAVAWCLDRQDYDLVGELLLTWPILGMGFSPTASFAYKVLTEIFDRVGFVPVPDISISEFSELPSSDRRPYWISATYHAEYVAGLLFATLLTRPVESLARRGTGPSPSTTIPEEVIRRSPYERHWQSFYDGQSARDRPALAWMVWWIALRRCADDGDLTGVAAMAAELDKPAFCSTGLSQSAMGIVRRSVAFDLFARKERLAEMVSNGDANTPSARTGEAMS